MRLSKAIFLTHLRMTLLLLVGSCGPESVEDTLEENVRKVCELGRGVCYGEGIVMDAVAHCVESNAVDGLERARDESENCARLYSEFFECAAQWTCEEFLDFLTNPDTRCQINRKALDKICPGTSPFLDDQDPFLDDQDLE